MTCDRNNPRRIRLVLAAVLMAASYPVAQAQAQEPKAASGKQETLTERGRAIAFDRSKGNCLSCHVIAGGDLPGTIGPPLDNIKGRFPDRKELTAILHDETKRNPLTVMPPFGRNLILSDDEIEAVVDFLYSL